MFKLHIIYLEIQQNLYSKDITHCLRFYKQKIAIIKLVLMTVRLQIVLNFPKERRSIDIYMYIFIWDLMWLSTLYRSYHDGQF